MLGKLNGKGPRDNIKQIWTDRVKKYFNKYTQKE